jgi:hypothetical protein
MGARGLESVLELGVARSFQQLEVPEPAAERVQHDLHRGACAAAAASTCLPARRASRIPRSRPVLTCAPWLWSWLSSGRSLAGPRPREGVPARDHGGPAEPYRDDAPRKLADRGASMVHRRALAARKALQPSAPVTPSSFSPISGPCSPISNWYRSLAWSLLRILTMFSARPVAEFSSM